MFPPQPRRGRILRLAFPIIGGMISQNLLNLVDTAFVSRLGDEAIAAVGYGSFANFMSMAFITGLAAGVQAMAARRRGERRESETAVPLNGGLILAVVFGVPLATVAYLVAPHAMPLIASEHAVAELSTTYLAIRLLGLPAVGMNFAFRGYWNAIEMGKAYFRTILVMHVVNAVLDYALIFGELGAPRLGVAGAAWASLAATWTGTAYYFVQALAMARPHGFMRSIPTAATMGTMLRTSIPAAAQQFLFAAGMTAFFALVGRLGTSAVAAANVLVNLQLVAVLPAIGFGLASASLVGQALGQNDVARARRWGWDVVRTATPIVTAVAVLGVVFPGAILSVFLHDPQTHELALWPLRISALALPLDVVGMVLLNSLLGAGDSTRVLVVSTAMQWLVFLPAVWLVGPHLGLGLVAVYLVNAVYRLVQSGIFAAIWSSEAWTRVRV